MTRLLAIGDVHGCFSALQTLLAYADITSQDQLIMMGDYVDRGPKSREVVQWLIDYSKTSRLVALRGNHEIMMLNAQLSRDDLQRWCRFGGTETLASYTNDPDGIGSIEEVLDEHWSFLSNHLAAYFESDNHLFVHGFVAAKTTMNEQTDETLYWSRYWDGFPGHNSGKTVVCGHKSQSSGVPVSNGKAICIDTAACKGGWLTCLDVNAETLWQANEEGATRSFRLCESNDYRDKRDETDRPQ